MPSKVALLRKRLTSVKEDPVKREVSQNIRTGRVKEVRKFPTVQAVYKRIP